MTAANATVAAGPEPGTAGRLVRTARVELLKLWTTRMWWGLLIGGVGLVALATLGVAAGVSNDPGVPPSDPVVLRLVYGMGIYAGQIFPVILGVIAMAGEYRHKTITNTFLVTPRRGQVVLAKMLALFVAGAGYGVALTGTAVLVGSITLGVNGYGPGLGADGVPRALALSVLGCGLFGIFGVGLATLVRNQIAAIILALGLAYIVQTVVNIVSAFSDVVAEINRYLPANAAAAMIAGGSGGENTSNALTWWAGTLVLLAYAVAFAIVGWALTTRRDVS